MMYIEGHWETIDTLRDVSKIIREYYNCELADEMDKLIDIQEEEIKTLENDIINLEDYAFGYDDDCD